jgi:hypothetical protein
MITDMILWKIIIAFIFSDYPRLKKILTNVGG